MYKFIYMISYMKVLRMDVGKVSVHNNNLGVSDC